MTLTKIYIPIELKESIEFRPDWITWGAKLIACRF